MAFRRKSTYRRKRTIKKRAFKKRIYKRRVRRVRKTRKISRRIKTSNNYICYKVTQSAGVASLSGSGTSKNITWSNDPTVPTCSNYQFVANPSVNADNFFTSLSAIYQQFRIKKVVFKAIPRFSTKDLQKYEANGNPFKMVVFPNDPAKPGQTYGYQLYERAMQQPGARAYSMGATVKKVIKPTLCDLKQMYAWDAVPTLTNNYNRFQTIKYPWIDNTIYTGEMKSGVPPTAPLNMWFPGLNQDQETCQTTVIAVNSPLGANMSTATKLSNQRNTTSQLGYPSDPDGLDWDIQYDIYCEFRRPINQNS
jgi:hypothetical protein